MTISLPNSIASATGKMLWLFFWRLLMGVGIGGDYPMSASIMAERAHLKRRGQLLGWIFSNQGWVGFALLVKTWSVKATQLLTSTLQGTLAGSILTLIILACFEYALDVESQYGQLDAIWRIQLGVALVPALLTLYPRITMPEGKKYLESRELNGLKRPSSTTSNYSTSYRKQKRESIELIVSDGRELQEQIDAVRAEIDAQNKRARLDVFIEYFSEWKHLRTLIGTASTWFLMDVAFYGTNLNQSVILTDIGFSKGNNEFETLKRNAIGNLIIAVAGYVPGYFVTIFFIERLGRRWIQIQGFLVTALMFAVIAGDYAHLGTGGRFVCLAIAQVCHPRLFTTHLSNPFHRPYATSLNPIINTTQTPISSPKCLKTSTNTIYPHSSSSTSAPTHQPSSSPPKSSPPASGASATASPPRRANSAPSSPPCCSTTSRRRGACRRCCGSSSRVSFWARW